MALSLLAADTMVLAEQGLRNRGRESAEEGLEEGIHPADLERDQTVRIDLGCQLEGVRRYPMAYHSQAVVVPDDPVALNSNPSYAEEHWLEDSPVWQGTGFGEMARGSQFRAAVRPVHGNGLGQDEVAG